MSKNLIRSIKHEQITPIEVAVRGVLPSWIQGTLFRNGPGRFKYGNKSYKHLFDGAATVNKFEIKDGKVFFSNKILETGSHKKTLETNNLQLMFGTPDLCSTVFSRFKAMFIGSRLLINDNVNVNVVPFGNNQLYALTETSMISRINPKDLSIISTENIRNHIKPTISALAHPHMDGPNGGWINVGLQQGKKPTYDFMKFTPGNNVQHLCEGVKLLCQVPSSHEFGLSYFHSFGLTKNYIVFLEQSLRHDLKKMLWNTLFNKSFSSALTTDHNFTTKIHIINRHTGEILKQKFHSDPQFSFHMINAYETETSENEIVLDLCSYRANEFEIENLLYDENELTEDFFNRFISRPRRIRIPINKSKQESIYCDLEVLNSKTSLELPTINYDKFNTKNYSYAYGIGTSKSPYTVIKIDTNKPNECIEAVIKSSNEIQFPSEPIFVENPEAKSEDDGVLLSLIHGDKHDFLTILDAKTLDEVARAELPENVKHGFTFHGFFGSSKNFPTLNQ